MVNFYVFSLILNFVEHTCIFICRSSETGTTDAANGGAPQPRPQNKRLQQTQAQVDEVVDIMRVNMEKVLERDAKLSQLDDRAGNIFDVFCISNGLSFMIIVLVVHKITGLNCFRCSSGRSVPI